MKNPSLIRRLPARGFASRRSGITLLFVISLIVLFLLMGTSFVLLARQYRNSAVAGSRIDTRIDDSRSLVQRAFYDLLREPALEHVNSPLRGHSLLGDQYGYGARSQVITAEVLQETDPMGPPNLGNQILRIDMSAFQLVADGTNGTFSNTSGAYDGQVLSFLDGPFRGVSTRILRYQVVFDTSVAPPVVLNRWFYFLAPSNLTQVLVSQTAAVPPADQLQALNVARLIGNQVLLNNREFSGSGAGIFDGDPVSGRAAVAVDQPALVRPAAGGLAPTLLPNRAGESRDDFFRNYAAATYTGSIPPLPPGPPLRANYLAFNEEYDALDFQNMFLSGWVGGTFVPSFHRPTLIVANGAGGLTNRRDSFLADRRNAAGTTLYQDADNNGIPDNGYDVDTDNDGVADSIWMDIDLPIQTDINGRRLKPLVAFKVVDMDGRLNLNAHGNLTQQEFDADRFKATWQNFLRTGAPFSVAPNPAVPGAPVSFGQGYGPPEISLSPALNATQFQAVLRGNGTQLGRYGADLIPGGAGRDLASSYKLVGYPDANFPNRGLLRNQVAPGPGFHSLFSTAVDLHGRFAWGVADEFSSTWAADPYDTTAPVFASLAPRMPTIDMLTSNLTNEVVNSAYEMDFRTSPFSAAPSGVDTPFSAREMESLLRSGDWDSLMLPPRLRQLLFGNTFVPSSNDLKEILTTDSYEVPIPSANLSLRLREALIRFGGGNFGTVALGPNAAQELAIQQQVRFLVAPEVMQGRRMDLNVPFGNGFDNNGNGVVDDPSESPLGEVRFDVYGRPNVLLDHDRNGAINAGDLLARQIFARRLYVLILLATQLVDRDGNGVVNGGDWFDYNGDTVVDVTSAVIADNDLKLFRRDIAQWVANVVDFRDPDSICSGFEFDLDPWDGWGVDGNLATVEPPGPGLGADDRIVVWGAERPELLLTETMIFHDRRTEDLDTDPSGRDIAGGDNDRDSLLVPNASMFVELFNPWYDGPGSVASSPTTMYPEELYGANGVDLGRYAVNPATNDRSPVWRVSVLRRADGAGAEQRLRAIYFVEPTEPALRTVAFGEVFFPDVAAVAGKELPPGQFAVLGSSGITAGTTSTTYLGRRNTPSWATELGDTRSISLDYAADLLSLRWWDDTNGRWETTDRRVVAIPVGSFLDAAGVVQNRSLGATDPIGGYVSLTGGGSLGPVPDGQQFLDVASVPFPLDEPADFTANGGADEWEQFEQFDNTSLEDPAITPAVGGLRDNGLHPGVRRIQLERLANPLLPYDPTTNPYLVMDAIGADVATFNGLVPNSPMAPTDRETDAAATDPTDLLLASFERSTNQNGPAANPDPASFNPMLLWRADLRGRIENPAWPGTLGVTEPFAYPAFGTTDNHFVPQNLVQSLGEIDLGYRTQVGAAASVQRAFPWLTWNNRPFVSQLELAHVPWAGNGKLLETFTAHVNGTSEFIGITPVTPDKAGLRGPFRHLPNFWDDDYSRTTGSSPRVPGLHRILEFLEVPSRFTGTQFELRPQNFSTNNVYANGNLPEMHPFYSPYNSVSLFREPGKINLNTLYDVTNQRVWRGLMGFGTWNGNNVGYGHHFAAGPFDSSRQGLGGGLPTDYPHVFRSPERGNFVPELAAGTLVVSSAQPTLFRASVPAVPQNNGNNPLLDFLSLGVPRPHFDPQRNAYFRYDARQRLGNLTTCRSSVFAIWVTVGFFEVNDQGLPMDEAKDGPPRQRGFFMIDRSIPVAFEPGRNHNVDRVILTSSIIE